MFLGALVLKIGPVKHMWGSGIFISLVTVLEITATIIKVFIIGFLLLFCLFGWSRGLNGFSPELDVHNPKSVTFILQLKAAKPCLSE